jgi:uncharacterized protein (DUF1697 family)
MTKGRQVALIRGINVGRAKRVAMAELREMLEDFGYTDVRTLLNSGNVVFTAPKDSPGEAAARIEKGLVLRLDVDARVAVLTAAELAKVVAENPLLDVADDPPRHLAAVPLERADLAKLKPLAKQKWGDEALGVGAHAAYLWCADGILDSPLLKAVSRALGNAVTTRNWATILKLQELLAAKG